MRVKSAEASGRPMAERHRKERLPLYRARLLQSAPTFSLKLSDLVHAVHLRPEGAAPRHIPVSACLM